MLNQQWGLMIWTFVTFGLSVLILWKFAFGPLQRIIDERRGRIQESLDEADATRAEAQRLLDEYRETLEQVRAEAQEMLERSRAAGEKAREELTGEARAQAERIVADAHQQIERDKNAALRELRTQIAELTALAAEKVAVRSLGEADQRRLIDEALAELEVDQLGVEERA